MAASSGLQELYRQQEKAPFRRPPSTVLKIAFVLLLVAALVGPFGVSNTCAGLCIVFIGGSGAWVISLNPLLALISLAVIAVGVHGIREESWGELVLAALLGLLLYPLFLMGTILSAAALLVLWRADRKRRALATRG